MPLPPTPDKAKYDLSSYDEMSLFEGPTIYESICSKLFSIFYRYYADDTPVFQVVESYEVGITDQLYTHIYFYSAQAKKEIKRFCNFLKDHIEDNTTVKVEKNRVVLSITLKDAHNFNQILDDDSLWDEIFLSAQLKAQHTLELYIHDALNTIAGLLPGYSTSKTHQNNLGTYYGLTATYNNMEQRADILKVVNLFNRNGTCKMTCFKTQDEDSLTYVCLALRPTNHAPLLNELETLAEQLASQKNSTISPSTENHYSSSSQSR